MHSHATQVILSFSNSPSLSGVLSSVALTVGLRTGWLTWFKANLVPVLFNILPSVGVWDLPTVEWKPEAIILCLVVACDGRICVIATGFLSRACIWRGCPAVSCCRRRSPHLSYPNYVVWSVRSDQQCNVAGPPERCLHFGASWLVKS